jgi:hypothetical protein
VAVGLLAAAVAAGMAYAVPLQAEAAAPGSAAVPGHHLSTRLSALVAAEEAGLGPAATAEALSLPATGAGSLLRTPDGQNVVVDVRFSSYSRSRVDGVEAAGGRIVHRSPGSRQVTVAALPEELTAIGEAAGVEYMGEELTPQVNAVCDATISEGDAILHANQLRATGVDGTGVKVGVISDSYNMAVAPATNAAQDIASDNLPGAANTCGHTTVSAVGDKPTAGTDEGRAMMQIVHDLAPGAAIDFETAFISEPSFAAAITKLADQGASVIVDDVSYFDEPMYQDGIVEQAVTGVRARGVNYFSSSANNRLVKNGHEVGSYEAVGGYRPTACPAVSTITATHVDCHNFSTAGAPDSTFSYTPANGPTIRTILNWAEPWNGVNTDFDLYLVNENTNAVLLSGADVNTGAGGSQKTFEIFAGTQLTSVGTWGIVVARKSAVAPAGTPRFKLLFAENGAQPFTTLEHETPVAGTTDVMGPTTFGHNGGADAMSVGASDVRVATALNSYSSYGPVTTLFGPVNGVTPAAALASPRVVAKPDLVASDCQKNTFFGGGSPPRFCGTSAAAPHAAAVAALLRQKFPSATTAAINAAMVSTANPIAGVPGSFQGGGLLNALAAATALTPPPPPKPAPDTTITKAPKKTVRTTKRKTKVTFKFTSTIAGSTFACSIDGKAFKPCTSPKTYKLKVGKHTFKVRATAGGITDPTPAQYTFKIKKKH